MGEAINHPRQPLTIAEELGNRLLLLSTQILSKKVQEMPAQHTHSFTFLTHQQISEVEG